MARKPNQEDAQLLLHLYEMRRESELRRARQWFLSTFQPTGWDEIQQRYLSFVDEDRWFRMTISYWEMVATLVNRGVLHPDLFFDHTGEDVVTWNRCKPWIEGARASIRPSYLYQFERMVNDHLKYRDKVNAAVTKSAGKQSKKGVAKAANAPKRGGKR